MCCRVDWLMESGEYACTFRMVDCAEVYRFRAAGQPDAAWNPWSTFAQRWRNQYCEQGRCGNQVAAFMDGNTEKHISIQAQAHI